MRIQIEKQAGYFPHPSGKVLFGQRVTRVTKGVKFPLGVITRINRIVNLGEMTLFHFVAFDDAQPKIVVGDDAELSGIRKRIRFACKQKLGGGITQNRRKKR